MRKYILLLIVMLSIVTTSGQGNDKKYKNEFRNKGYFNITRLGIIPLTKLKQETFTSGVGNQDYELSSEGAIAYSFQTINGYFINPHLRVGLGVGLDGYHNPNVNTMPLFIDTRLYFNETANSTYLVLDLGVLLGITNGPKRGGMANIGMGYKFKLAPISRLFFVSDLSLSH